MLATHIGLLLKAEAKIREQAVGPPVPVVITPFVSVPETLELVPHELTVGAAPELAMWPVTVAPPVDVIDESVLL